VSLHSGKDSSFYHLRRINHCTNGLSLSGRLSLTHLRGARRSQSDSSAFTDNAAINRIGQGARDSHPHLHFTKTTQGLKHLPGVITELHRYSKKSKRHLKILGSKTVTQIKYNSEGPQTGVKLQNPVSKVTLVPRHGTMHSNKMRPCTGMK
jgi:hypothetical protein